jgi:hypothetical protein
MRNNIFSKRAKDDRCGIGASPRAMIAASGGLSGVGPATGSGGLRLRLQSALRAPLRYHRQRHFEWIESDVAVDKPDGSTSLTIPRLAMQSAQPSHGDGVPRRHQQRARDRDRTVDAAFAMSRLADRISD